MFSEGEGKGKKNSKMYACKAGIRKMYVEKKDLVEERFKRVFRSKIFFLFFVYT